MLLVPSQWRGTEALLEQLINADADASSPSGVDMATPMHLASYGALLNGRTFTEAMDDYSVCIANLAAKHADLEAKDAAGWTPLLIAARSSPLPATHTCTRTRDSLLCGDVLCTHDTAPT